MFILSFYKAQCGIVLEFKIRGTVAGYGVDDKIGGVELLWN